MRTYRQLFATAEFRTLFVAQSLTMAAGASAGLALGTITFAETGSALLTGLSMFGGPLVALLSSSFLLSASDTLRPRTALVVVAAVVGALDLVQAIPGIPVPARFLLLALMWLVLSSAAGAAIGLMADLLPEDAFVLGRSTLNIGVGTMQIAGYGLGGLLLLVMSASGLFLTAGVCSLLAALLLRTGLDDHAPRAAGPVLRRTMSVNRVLIGSPVLRPIYLSSWVPNGLVVGCEALFIPFAGERGGYLLAASAAGMLAGDVVVGRFVPAPLRDRLLHPLRVLLAVPFLAFWWVPPLPVAMALVLVAGFGFSASLPLQERMVAHTARDVRGQALGLRGTGLSVGQAAGALVAGTIADALGAGTSDVARTMAVMGAVSLVVTVALVPGLRRSAQRYDGSSGPVTPQRVATAPHGSAYRRSEP